ncbi:MAG: DUF2075 domain-containing protein [Deltaproteobacteria bacterium]|nr:DUF2075 domain-containing protein [Deltaproteobacteria bacterium]
MIALYRASVKQFVVDCRDDVIADNLARAFPGRGREEPSPEEKASWVHSLGTLASLLRTDPDLCTADVFVEFLMPLSGGRADVVLTGRDPLGRDTAVVLELKQWGRIETSHLPEHVVMGGRVCQHPSVQVGGYVRRLRHFHSAFRQGDSEAVQLHGVAWLHNMPPGRSLDLLRDVASFGPWCMDYRLFGRDDGHALLGYFRATLLPGPSTRATDKVAAGRHEPSPKLLDVLVRTIDSEHAWNLLDEQRRAYWEVRDAVQKAKVVGADGPPTVIIVRGGPGTGKSVLAIQLMADAARQEWKVIHATGSKAFQTVLQAQVGKGARERLKHIFGARFLTELPVRNLFATFAEVARAGDSNPGQIDLTVCDEAHRLWTHRKVVTPAGTVKWQATESMVREVVRASRVTAFFLDDNQSVRAGEVGNSSLIEREAAAMGARVARVDLDQQFRCAGSTSYIHWVDQLAGYATGSDLSWRVGETPEYEFALEPDMPTMAARIRQKQALQQRCRIVAGYCWRWSKPGASGLPHDLVDKRFGGWSGAWIEKTGKDLAPEDHQYYKWATQESHRDQIGSIYSAQGFEFDYVGVIWGEDLVWRTDKWVYQKERNKDGSFKRQLRAGGDPEAMLSNVYRVLLTRGMRGTSLFVLDPETRAHVARALEPNYETLWSARSGRPGA